MYAQFRISVYKLKLIFYFSLFFTLGLFNYLSRKRKIDAAGNTSDCWRNPFSSQCCISIPPENIGKPLGFFYLFRGYRNVALPRNGSNKIDFYTEKLSSVKSKVLWIEIKTYIFHISTIYLNHHQRCHNRFCHSKNNTAFFWQVSLIVLERYLAPLWYSAKIRILHILYLTNVTIHNRIK